ncbi:MAG: hypothetical protein ACFUZC_21080 [Chthoniobacteraceae bacterium]
MSFKISITKWGMAVVIGWLTVVPVLAIEQGEDANGRIPPENAIHLKRIKGPSLASSNALFQNSINLKPGGDYIVSFWARATDTFKMNVSTKLCVAPWAFFGLRSEVQLTPSWRRYSLPFKADGAIPEHSRLTFEYAAVAEVWIADVQIRTSGGSDNQAEHAIANARFIDDLEQWYVDGMKKGAYEATVEPMSASTAEASK